MSRISKGFTRIAPYYDLLSRIIFGNKILESQRCFLNNIEESSKILIIGGGTGRILEELDRQKISIRVDYIDISEGMLRRARERETSMLDVKFSTNKDQLRYSNYDYVITPFYLDIYTDTDLREEMNKIYTLLSRRGKWLWTDFQISKRSFNSYWQLPLAFLMYSFFRLTTGIKGKGLPDFEKAFKGLGLILKQEKYFFGNFIVSRVYQNITPLKES